MAVALHAVGGQFDVAGIAARLLEELDEVSIGELEHRRLAGDHGDGNCWLNPVRSARPRRGQRRDRDERRP
jgi:hypothetical protein